MPYSLLPPYQRLRRETEVVPALGFSGPAKSLVNTTSFIVDFEYGVSGQNFKLPQYPPPISASDHAAAG